MGPNNIVMTWTPDGKNIVYRNRISDGFDGKLWSISKTEECPKWFHYPKEVFAAIPPMEKAGLQPGYARIP